MFIKMLFIITIYIFIHNDANSNENRERIINYLENFFSLSSDFVQVNNSGDVLSGKLYVSRPGKFRIEYNQIPLILISDSKRLASINKELKNISFHSFDQLPVNVLLFRRLSVNEIKILNLVESENTLSIDVVNSKFEDKGFINIIFEIRPFSMKKWTIFKNDRTKTEVFFDSLILDRKLSPKLFDIESEDPRKIPFKTY